MAGFLLDNYLVCRCMHGWFSGRELSRFQVYGWLSGGELSNFQMYGRFSEGELSCLQMYAWLVFWKRII